MFYQVSKIQLALNTPALYPCQRAIPLSTARISLPGLGSLKNKDSDLLNKGVAKSDSTRELLNRNTVSDVHVDSLTLFCQERLEADGSPLFASLRRMQQQQQLL